MQVLDPEDLEYTWPSLSKSGINIHSSLKGVIKALPKGTPISPVLSDLANVDGSSRLVLALIHILFIPYAVDHILGNAECELTECNGQASKPGRPRLSDKAQLNAWAMVMLLRVCWPGENLGQIYARLAVVPSGENQRERLTRDQWERRYKQGAKVAQSLPAGQVLMDVVVL
jgi:hypothetical protein